MIFLLEDNPDRLAEMRRALGRELPGRSVHVEDDAAAAIAWLAANLVAVDLISLDHDLDSVPRPGDPPGADHGCGRDVADHLAGRPPTCPVIVHTTNATAGDGMYFALARAGWPTYRVYPSDHHRWVGGAWAEQVRELVARGWT